MNHAIVHVDIDLNVSIEDWLSYCEANVEHMLRVPGLEWKVWLASPDGQGVGGIYLFSDASAARAYVDGPILAALRAAPTIKAVRVRQFAVADRLSERTGGIRGGADARAV